LIKNILKNFLCRARVRLVASSRKRSIAAKAGWALRRERKLAKKW